MFVSEALRSRTLQTFERDKKYALHDRDTEPEHRSEMNLIEASQQAGEDEHRVGVRGMKERRAQSVSLMSI